MSGLPPTGAPARIVVVQTAFLGDVVFASPLVRSLKAAWPGSMLSLVSTARAAGLAGCVPGVDRVVPFDKRGADGGLSGLLRVARALGPQDLALVPHPSPRSALLARLSGASVRVGHARWATRWAFTLTVPHRGRAPFVERALDLARGLGLPGSPRLSLEAPPEEVARARALFAGRRCLGLVIGSEWATKRWTPAGFGALAELAAEAGLTPVLLGAPSERPLAEAIKAAASRARPLDLVGNPILESVGAISQLAGVVGGDSGLLHVARALGVPSLLLFGPTDPAVHVFEPHAQALRVGLACQPCHAHGPKVCPLGHHDCMRRLTAERVWNAFEGLRGEAA